MSYTYTPKPGQTQAQGNRGRGVSPANRGSRVRGRGTANSGTARGTMDMDQGRTPPAGDPGDDNSPQQQQATQGPQRYATSPSTVPVV